MEQMDDLLVDTIKKDIASQIPEAVFLGNGHDGCVFKLSNSTVLKVIPDNRIGVAEIIALKAMNGIGSSLAPRLYDYGLIGSYVALIREQLDNNEDRILEECPDYTESGINYFLLNHAITLPGLINSTQNEREIANGIRETVETFIEDSMNSKYIMEDSEFKDSESPSVDVIMEQNSFLSEKFLHEYGTMLSLLNKQYSISAHDCFISNMGFTSNGEIRLRDASRFYVPDEQIENVLSEGLDDITKRAIAFTQCSDEHLILENPEKIDFIFEEAEDEDGNVMPPKDEGQVLAEILKDGIELIVDGSELLGAGADGCVFGLDGKHIMKVIFPTNYNGVSELHEIVALKALRNICPDMLPELKSHGKIGELNAFIREDLEDVKDMLVEFSTWTFSDNLLHPLCDPAIDLEGMSDDKREYFLDNHIFSFMEQNYNGDDHSMEVAENPFLQHDFLIKFNKTIRAIKAADIIPLDFSVDNFGMDKNGEIKIRDVSRFVCPENLIKELEKAPCPQITIEAVDLYKAWKRKHQQRLLENSKKSQTCKMAY